MYGATIKICKTYL